MSQDARASSEPVAPLPEEVDGRRLLAADAVWCAAVGSGVVLAGKPVAAVTELPAWLVRTAGMATVTWAGAVLVGSLAEDWVAATRRVVAVNTIAGAGLLGLAASRGRLRGRLLAVALSVQVGGFALAQVRVLVRRQGPMVVT